MTLEFESKPLLHYVLSRWLEFLNELEIQAVTKLLLHHPSNSGNLVCDSEIIMASEEMFDC